MLHKPRGRLDVCPDSSAADHPGVTSLVVHVKAVGFQKKKQASQQPALVVAGMIRFGRGVGERGDGGDVSESLNRPAGGKGANGGEENMTRRPAAGC